MADRLDSSSREAADLRRQLDETNGDAARFATVLQLTSEELAQAQAAMRDTTAAAAQERKLLELELQTLQQKVAKNGPSRQV